MLCNGYERHFCLIKNMSGLLASQVSKHKSSVCFCHRCLHYFLSEEKLAMHKINCNLINKCAVKLPVPGKNIMEFKNFHKKMRSPFIIYADLKSILKPVQDPPQIANAYQQHEVFAIGFYLKASYEDCPLEGYYSHRGPDSAEWFAKKLKNLAFEIHKV